MTQINGATKAPVVALIKQLPRSALMPKSYTITYKDHQTAPDLIEKAAALHGIEPELLIKRFITEGLKPYLEPMKDISEFDSLEECFKGNGLRK
tara:strand:- start:275 stop:556 length:282 start_codon:yes stop_codon:yes gene_type:complete